MEYQAVFFERKCVKLVRFGALNPLPLEAVLKKADCCMYIE
ncbi:MAG: hypothetical protein AB1547_00620 [Thermodesulfobacteriota bacterium]